MKKNILFSIIIVLTSAACERQFNVDFENEKPLIVMNGVVEPDKPIEITVSKSFPFLNTDSAAAYVKDASVMLHINGKYVENMQLTGVDNALNTSRRGRSFFRSVAHANIGDRVRIEVSAPDMETAWAETVIPTPPTIGKVETTPFLIMAETDGSYGNYGGYGDVYDRIPEISREPFLRMLRLHIDVQRADNNNSQYFLLNLMAVVDPEKTIYNNSRYGLYINTQDDPIFANDPKNSIFDALFEKSYGFSGSRLFSDNAFKNNAYTLNVSTYGYYYIDIEYEENEDGAPSNYKSHTVRNLPIEIQVSSLASGWYAYLKSKETGAYDDEGLGFISEPKITSSNVHNGIGFLGSMSQATKIIETPPFDGKENEVPW